MSKISFIMKFIACFIVLLAFEKVNAQTLPVGTPVLEDYYRRQQLLGNIDSNISFTVRPLYPVKSLKINDVFDPDEKLYDDGRHRIDKKEFAGGKGVFQLLPFNWQQQYNSDHPYGWNDGMMIPAKGYQTLISGGFFFKYGPFSIQFRPDYVYAVNPAFNGYATGKDDLDLVNYYSYHNLIDNPERYGNSAFHKASLGQSSIRLTVGALSLGLSNENLWWGPGIRNSLIMSNNAPGFKHLTFNTVRPINTFLGSFEGQIIAAQLENSNLPQLLTTTTSTGLNLFSAPRDAQRYYTGFNLSYHPKWVPGLFFGLIRTFDAYKEDVNTLGDYFPFLIPYTKISIGNEGDAIPRDQQTSVSARWLFTKAHAEVYFEYGLNDNSYNLNDFIGSPEHSRAYVFGLRKLIPLQSRPGEGILFSGEITQLSQSIDRVVREASGWYIHGQVRQGTTNFGQVIGAGTGSGGNLQSADISWTKGLKKLGITFERYEHDVDFYHSYIGDLNGHSRNWVDYAFGVQGDWNYKNLLINARLQGIESLNYEWVLRNYNATTYYIPNNNVFNIHAELGLTYRF